MPFTIKLVIYLLMINSVSCQHHKYEYITVSTTHGTVKGHILNITGYNVIPGSTIDVINMFLGIPYAEPPVNDLRFARPVEKTPWNPAEYDATRIRSACPQKNWFLRTYSFPVDYDDFSEDCLYINIYAPQSSTEPGSTYPVMFWIHGGAYTYGSGAEFDGRVLAQEGVVVVTINYRVGVLGFLSTDDDVAPGNYGLLDQLMALKWVKDNIARFHGDPDRITVFGQSAGGGSTSLHMFSQKARGLFNSLIPQSGCALSPWAIYRPPHKTLTAAKELATTLGCPNTASNTEMVKCLRGVSADALVQTSVSGPPMIATFAPRVDGYYITDLPENLIARGEYTRHVNVMTGCVPQELSEDMSSIPGIDDGLTAKEYEDILFSKSRRYLDNADAMYGALKCVYPTKDTGALPNTANRDNAVDMNSDYGYVSPHIKLAKQLSARGEHVWLYDYTYRSLNSTKKEWIGVPHAEELYYQFGAPFFESTPCPSQGGNGTRFTCPVTWGRYQPWGEQDKEASRAAMKLWAEFSRLRHNANRFPSTGSTGATWPQYSDTTNSYLNISASVTSSVLRMTPGQTFWDSYNYLNLSATIPDVCLHQPGIIG